MTIQGSSRYFNSDIEYIQLTANGGDTPVVFYDFTEIGKITYDIHVYTQGERLDDIANKYYGKPGLWWVIPEYNPTILDFQNLLPGTELVIPRV